MEQARKGKILVNTVLAILSVLWIFPALFALLGMFKNRQEYNLGNFWDLPKGINLAENIKEITGILQISKSLKAGLCLYLCSLITA